MAQTIRRAIEGRYPSCYIPSRLEERRANNRAWRLQRRPDSDTDSEEDSPAQRHLLLSTSNNWVDYLRSREIQAPEPRSVDPTYGTRHMVTHELFRENPISLGYLHRVFCSQWLSDREVVFGTQCSKLMVYDVRRRSLDAIPTLRGRRPWLQQDLQTGIHALQINPSKTLLATGARNSSELAVYSLPTLDPVCIGEGHNDCILAICCLDDEVLLTGSHDSKLALWRVPPPPPVGVPHHDYIQPICLKNCRLGEVLALTFNENWREIAALTKKGYIYSFNAELFPQKLSRKLPFCTCLATQREFGVHALGCDKHLLLLDSRTLQTVKKIKITSGDLRGYIESASFRGNMLTLGTDLSYLMFYDIRAGKCLESNISSETVTLKTSKGNIWMPLEGNEEADSSDVPAIYTHCYDESGTRIFTAGGPCHTSLLQGNYAGLWQ